MIRIKPYTELSAYDEIKQLYLELVARALPFAEKNLTGEPSLFPGRPFACIKKSKAGRPPTVKESRKIIGRYSKQLYAFLFTDAGKLKRESLHTLLFSFMDEPTRIQNGLVFDVDDSEQPLDAVFSYERFSNSQKIHRFVKLLGVPVCPYCNRSFTTTLERGEDSEIRTRPELDHYLSKSKYPVFALSLYNLVPSCGTCNRLKSSKEEAVIYPFKEGMGERYRFRTDIMEDATYLTGTRVDFDLRLAPTVETKDALQEHAENSKKIFGLEEIYREAHKSFVSDLYFQRYVFTDELLGELFMQFQKKENSEGLFKNLDEVKRFLYLRGISEQSWGERPLSKLVHDIDREISELYASRKKE